MSRVAVVGARVLRDGRFDAATVVVERGRVVSIDAPGASNAAGDVRDAHGLLLAPGYVDLQVNGGGDVLFNDAPTVETIERIARAHRAYGVTSLLPTLITDDRATMQRAIAAVDAAIEAGVPGIVGIHLEGPHLSGARKGVHDAAKFREPSAGDLDLLASLRSGRTLVTLAPECVTPAFIAALVERGVVVSAGHTQADYDTLARAIDAGLTGVTHLFNAMSPLGSRQPGVVGAALDSSRVHSGLIADGRHVHAATMRIACAAARGRVFLVSDAMPPVGGESRRFRLGALDATVQDGVCVTADGVLAGSALELSQAVRNAVDWLRVDATEAIAMASTVPSRFMQLDTAAGVAVGARANFVLLDDALHVRATAIDGTWLDSPAA